MNNKPTRYLAWAAPLIALAVGVSACAGAVTPPASPAPPATPLPTATPVRLTPSPTAAPEATATPKEMCISATCMVAIPAMAWIDEDANGVRDKGEPPLPGVSFRRVGEDYSAQVSDESGMALVEFWFAGEPMPCKSLMSSPGDPSCDRATQRVFATGRVKGRPFAVEPEVPTGYRLTTPGGVSGGGVFGFAPLAPAAIPTR